MADTRRGASPKSQDHHHSKSSLRQEGFQNRSPGNPIIPTSSGRLS